MRIRVLGCSGGIGDERHTTSLLIDDDILIDAGSGVGRLALAALARIDHVFLTHAHLDHVLMLPPMLDSVIGLRSKPITVHALPEVLDILKQDLFNWRLWPDFTQIPSLEGPALAYAPIAVGEPVKVGAREITAIPAKHVVPTVGYRLSAGQGSLIFSGDTEDHPALWEIVAASVNLKHLIVECSFPNALRAVAEASKHYCPATLSAELARLRAGVPVWVTHMKPGSEAEILAELAQAGLGDRLQALREDQVFEL